jgi:SAM-dependent methyltransferase
MLNKLITLLLFLNFGCSELNQPQKTPVITKKIPIIKTEYKIGTIPDDLKTQTYKDDSGNIVSYDHEKQLKQLFKLANDGKKLYLILGRGNKEEKDKAKLPDNNGQIAWVYGEQMGDSLVDNNTPHLFMDFDNTANLASIPDELFDEIVFDWSVVKFFRNIEQSLLEYKRILKPGGKFLADLMVAGFAFAINGKFLPGSKIYTTRSGYKFGLEKVYGAIPEMDSRIYLNDSTKELVVSQIC